MTPDPWRFAPLLGLLVLGLVGIGGRVWVHHRRYGSFGIVLFRSGTLFGTLRDTSLLLLPVLLGTEAVLAAIAPGSLRAVGEVPGLGALIWRPIGALLMGGGTALMVVAQSRLGASWRLGIDETARPGLVTHGLYRFCRNPIYLGLLTALAAFVLLLPTWLSLACFVATYIGIRLQVGAEERYLERTYGIDYAAYARRVGRFVPWVGRHRGG